jgi:porin
MKRFYALRRFRFCAGWLVIALSVPFAAAIVGAGEWGGSPHDDIAYTFSSQVEQNAPPSGDFAPSDTPEEPLSGCGGWDYGEGGCGGYSCRSHSGNCLRQDHLFGDQWRASLAECGVIADLELTQFYQGVATGGARQDWDYGGKLDYFFTFDGQKLGLWKGLSAVMHAETRFGESVIFDAVGLAPVNANMLYPSPFDNDTAITGFLVNQALSEEWMISAGKYNLFDLFNQMYPQTGRGIDGFMNISAIAPLSVARTINLSVMGAGITKLHEGQVQSAVSVIDTHNSTTTSGFDDLFDNGAVILGYYRIFTEYGGRPGSHAVMGVYSSGTYTSLDPLTWAILPDSGLVAGQETGSWNIEYFFEQKLWVDRCNPQRNIGLFTGWGIADDNPSPIDWGGFVALQGQGLNAARPADTMGVAWFHTSLTSDFKNLVSPVLNLHDVSGVETYYNAAITPWFHLTGDLQVVEPADVTNDTALVLGLRANFSL